MKSLHKIASDHIKKFSKYLNLLETSPEEDVIHTFRREYKKIRALVRLSSTTNNKIKIASLLKEIYAVAGTVREYQLQQYIVKEAEENMKLTEYGNSLQKKISYSLNILRKKAATPHAKRSLHVLRKKFPEKINSPQAYQFIRIKIFHLLQLMEIKNKKDENIHGIRKTIKDLSNTFNTIRSLNLASVPILTHNQEEQFHNLSYQMGLFQDLCCVLSLLKPADLRRLPAAEADLLNRIKMKKIKIKKEEKRKILIELKKLQSILKKFAEDHFMN
ncbi:MAG TPA: CHAD domain-containing protein [Chitinophagaceae bacterium]|nr:CHAD domain-containing protein [Chitinophagaceae bacterium]